MLLSSHAPSTENTYYELLLSIHFLSYKVPHVCLFTKGVYKVKVDNPHMAPRAYQKLAQPYWDNVIQCRNLRCLTQNTGKYVAHEPPVYHPHMLHVWDIYQHLRTFTNTYHYSSTMLRI